MPIAMSQAKNDSCRLGRNLRLTGIGSMIPIIESIIEILFFEVKP
jgi:hypothetical protein